MSRRTDDMGHVLEYLDLILIELQELNKSECPTCLGSEKMPLSINGTFDKMVPCWCVKDNDDD